LIQKTDSVENYLIYFQKGENEPTATIFFSLLLLLSLFMALQALHNLHSEKSP
tara:strand:- start:1003 stop:1161 length:159 start_codon:yes stop_codon:yes gene_type:complete